METYLGSKFCWPQGSIGTGFTNCKKFVLFFSRITPIAITICMLSLVGTSAPALAASKQYVELDQKSFERCIPRLAERAVSAGVSESVIETALYRAQFQADVIKYDRNQPEFVRTFSNYISKRVTDWRINKGKQLLQEHKGLLQSLYQGYGIPPQYLVAFWGLETNFGSYKGKMPIIGSLATLACDYRRSEFFTEELVNALILLEREGISSEQMQGSWAGAMGHTQFMPSAYLKYALDGDGDGKVDLWHSVPDALTSAANFLHHLGWQPGYRWGREVLLPEQFDFTQTGRNSPKSLADWSALGLTQTSGASLGSADMQAAVLVPAGHQGPAFIVYDNFSVIMKWNFSEFYAISVGYLADRLTGAQQLHVPLPNTPTYSIAQVKELQNKLNHLGYDVGEADGILGPATRRGIQGFQSSQQLVADGFPHAGLFEAVATAYSNQQLLR